MAVWIYEVLLASPFSPKMSVATDAYKRLVLITSASARPLFGGHLEQRIYNADNNK